MAAVSNSSLLILYSAIGRLDILQAVFSSISIPSAVYAEVVLAGNTRPGMDEVPATPWITAQAVMRQWVLQELIALLDQGEAEAITLALELGGLLVVIDDLAGRRLVRERGLPLFGSAGTLVLAKQQRVISLARPIIDDLVAAGLRLSDDVYRRVFVMAGE